jgi:hypothetical protein
MKFPFQTQSKPVVGIDAQRLSTAISSGKSVTNGAARATFNRIVKNRARRDDREI